MGSHAQISKSLVIINPGNPTGQFIPLDDMIEFLRERKDMELVIVDESFIDFSGIRSRAFFRLPIDSRTSCSYEA